MPVVGSVLETDRFVKDVVRSAQHGDDDDDDDDDLEKVRGLWVKMEIK